MFPVSLCKASLRLPFSSVPDVDECLDGPAVCGDGPGVCENTLGSYKCACPVGYRGNGTHCEGSSLAFVSVHVKIGSLWRAWAFCCALVFSVPLCALLFPDENECASGGHGCDHNARCGNIIGSYFCQCYQGFNGDGRSCFGEQGICAFHNSMTVAVLTLGHGTLHLKCRCCLQILMNALWTTPAVNTTAPMSQEATAASVPRASSWIRMNTTAQVKVI